MSERKHKKKSKVFSFPKLTNCEMRMFSEVFRLVSVSLYKTNELLQIVLTQTIRRMSCGKW